MLLVSECVTATKEEEVIKLAVSVVVTETTCAVNWNTRQKQLYFTSVVVLGVTIPLLVMLILYGRILYFAGRRKTHGIYRSRKSTFKRRRKTLIFLISLTSFYSVCWLPYFSLQLVRWFFNKPEDYNTLTSWFEILGFINVALDPVFYFTLHADVKRQLKHRFVNIKIHFKKHSNSKVGDIPTISRKISKRGERPRRASRIIARQRHLMVVEEQCEMKCSAYNHHHSD